MDLLLIHETGLYVFEIKHYKGTIYGNDNKPVWTQYFRTAKNNTFKNPILQNEYHISALRKLFTDLPIHSCIVFTNYSCDIRVSNSNPNIDICRLSDVKYTLTNRFEKQTDKLSMDEIDKVFNLLSVYSQMRKIIPTDEKEADFITWVQPFISKLESEKAELEQEKNNYILQTKKSKTESIIVTLSIAFICIIVSVILIIGFKKGYDIAIQKNNSELSAFKQNFLHIDEIGNEYIDDLNSYVNVSNVSIKALSNKAVTFTARISVSNDVYGVAITEDSKYILMTDKGKVIEYDVFGEHLRYSWISNIIGNGYRSYKDLEKAQFYGVSKNEISYIKITGIEVFKLDINRTKVKDNLEIELYSKK